MTTAQAAEPLSGLLPVLDPLGEQLRALGSELGCSAMVESADGTLVGHHASASVSPVLITAILGRDARTLRHAFTDRRTLGLLPGGAARSGQLDGQPAAALPLPGLRGARGTVWLVGAPVSLDDPRLTDHLGRLVLLLQSLAQLTPSGDVADALTGACPVPMAFQSLRVSVLAIAGLPAAAVELIEHASAQQPLPGSILRTVTLEQQAFALLGTPHRISSSDVLARVDSWCSATDLRVGLASSADLCVAARQATTALSADLPGCVDLATARSTVLLNRVAEVIAQSSDLGPDAVEALVEEQPDFASTLLAWLDAQGDSAVAADQLDCHRNTLRYRVRRASELVGGMDDPCRRLEVHLRLRALLA